MSVLAAGTGQRRLVLALVLIVAVFVLFFPARQLVEQRQRIGALERRLAELRAENDLLSQDVRRLSDPAELEVLARERLGLVKPGERSYFVEPTAPPSEPTSREGAEPSWFARGWERFISLLRGRG